MFKEIARFKSISETEYFKNPADYALRNDYVMTLASVFGMSLEEMTDIDDVEVYNCVIEGFLEYDSDNDVWIINMDGN